MSTARQVGILLGKCATEGKLKKLHLSQRYEMKD